MEQKEIFDRDDLFERAKDYLDTNIELTKLTIVQSVVKTVGGVVSGVILVLIAIFFLLFLSLTAGLYFGELLGSMYQGFGIVALFYLIIGVIVLMMSENYIKNPIINKLISKILKKGD